MVFKYVYFFSFILVTIIIITLLILFGCLYFHHLLNNITAFILTSQRAKRNGEKIWDAATKLMLIHFLFPLVTGGIFGLILLVHEHFGIIAPITLIFYGLALVSASKYTLDTIKYLGISEIIVGLIAAYYVGYGLYFWAFGFGVLHIVYGMVMYLKERR